MATKIITYLLVHDWCFANGEVGHYELKFTDKDEAYQRFLYLQLLIENDEYDFNAIIPDFHKGDMSYSVYERKDSLMNRQDLSLKTLEVSL